MIFWVFYKILSVLSKQFKFFRNQSETKKEDNIEMHILLPSLIQAALLRMGQAKMLFGQACSPGVGEWNLTGHKTAYVPSCCKRDWAKVMNLVIE